MKVNWCQEFDGWIWDGTKETLDEINKHERIKEIGKVDMTNDLLIIENCYIPPNNWIIFTTEEEDFIEIFPTNSFIALGYKEVCDSKEQNGNS